MIKHGSPAGRHRRPNATHPLSRAAAAGLAVVSASAAAVAVAPAASALVFDQAAVPARTQVTVLNDNGSVFRTANAGQVGPAESLSKLLLAQWVLQHGAPQDKALVDRMIRFSDDGIASRLDRAYPQAIPGIIGAYGLGATSYNGYWGNVTTSTDDMARFVQAIKNDPVAQPIISAMAHVAPVAADGYRQDYGTATIPGVWGTKFGWADDGSINLTASLGPDYVVVARTYGPAGQLTADIGALRAGAAAPGAPAPAPAPMINLGSSQIPALTGAQWKAQVAPQDPLNLRMIVPDNVLIPKL